jgi:hypothetical protein
VFVSEEELPVQIAEIYRIQIHDVDLSKSSQDQVLEQFTSDSAGSDHQHTRLEALSAELPIIVAAQ